MKRYKECALLCLENQSKEELINIIDEFCERKSYKTEKRQTWTKNDTLVVFINKEELPLSKMILSAPEYENKVLISNIVPTRESGLLSLDYSEYNHILDTFKDDVFVEIKNKYSNIIEENQEDYTIQEIIPKSYKELIKWLNMYPLSGHTLDEHRWYDFLIALKNNKENISVSDFAEFIKENYQWSESDLEKYMFKFEEQTDLLNYYDEHK